MVSANASREKHPKMLSDCYHLYNKLIIDFFYFANSSDSNEKNIASVSPSFGKYRTCSNCQYFFHRITKPRMPSVAIQHMDLFTFTAHLFANRSSNRLKTDFVKKKWQKDLNVKTNFVNWNFASVKYFSDVYATFFLCLYVFVSNFDWEIKNKNIKCFVKWTRICNKKLFCANHLNY